MLGFDVVQVLDETGCQFLKVGGFFILGPGLVRETDVVRVFQHFVAGIFQANLDIRLGDGCDTGFSEGFLQREVEKDSVFLFAEGFQGRFLLGEGVAAEGEVASVHHLYVWILLGPTSYFVFAVEIQTDSGVLDRGDITGPDQGCDGSFASGSRSVKDKE